LGRPLKQEHFPARGVIYSELICFHVAKVSTKLELSRGWQRDNFAEFYGWVFGGNEIANYRLKILKIVVGHEEE